MNVGKLAGIYRFPIKSMLGEQVEHCRVETSGIPGDRQLALIDARTGKIASAKNPGLWKGLLKLTARTVENSIAVEFPDGRIVSVSDAGFESTMSDYLGRSVTLARNRDQDFELDRADPEEFVAMGSATANVTLEPLVIGAEAQGASSFFDFAPLHIVAESTVRAVAECCGTPEVDPLRYRPNIVVNDESNEPFSENQWIGRTLLAGGLQLRVTHPTPRCAIPTLPHGALSSVSSIVKTLVGQNKQEFLDKGRLPCLGVYATVTSPGEIRAGDTITLD